MKNRLVSWIPAIAWFCLSFYLLTLPGAAFPVNDWLDKLHADKLVHIFLFAVLVYLFYLPLKKYWTKAFVNKAMIITFLAFDYGIAMEFVQKYYIPNRSFDVWDIFADALGCMLPFIWLRQYIKKSSPA